MRIKQGTRDNSQGFTIIELMIATLVFSVILTVITFGVISFSNRYYRATRSSATQNSAQSIVEGVTQALQFGKGTVDTTQLGANGFFCAGGYSFTFDKNGVQFTNSVGQRGFYMAPITGNCVAQTTGGQQLLGAGMRISNFTLTGPTADSLYSLSISLAYADDDLLCSPTQANCTTTANLSPLWPVPDVACRSGAGSQYCAVSHLTTTVQKRVPN